MAGKDIPSAPKDRRNTKSVDTDFDFDFDDDFASLEGKSNAFENAVKSQKTKSKSREAVTNTFKGAIAGAKDSVFTENNLRTLVSSSLPDEYETIFTATGEVASGVSGVYNDAVKELRPSAKRFSKILDKMSKDEDSISRKLSNKVKDIFGIYDTTQGPSQAQQQEQTISSELGSIFNSSIEAQSKVQAELQARQETQQNIDRQVETKRFKTQFSSLASIDRSTATLAQYQTQITAGYQKKSLELQYRTYFAMSELLQESKKFFEVNQAQQSDVVKNTALPEYVKLQKSEYFAQQLRNKITEGLGKRLFDPQSAMRKGFANINKMVKERLTNLQMKFGQGFDMAEGLQQHQEAMQGMSGIDGMDMGPDGTMAGMAGRIGASVALEGPLEKLMRKTGAWVRKTAAPKGGQVEKIGRKLYGYGINPQAGARDALDSEFFKKYEHIPGMDFVKEAIKGFATDKPGSSLDSLYGRNNATSPEVSFDKRFYTSVTDVIPGYLARILVESRKMASLTESSQGLGLKSKIKSPKAELTRFDYDKGEFVDESDLKKDIKTHFHDIGQASGTDANLDKFIKTIGLDKKLDDAHKLAFKEALLRWIMSGEAVTLKAMSDPAFIRLIPIKQKKKITRELESLSSLSDQNAPGDDKVSIKSAFDIHGGKIKNSLPNLRAEAQTFENTGSGDLLKSMGMISRGKDGRSAPSVTTDTYVNSILGRYQTSDIHSKQKISPYKVTSDIHAKQDIKPVSDGSVLDSIVNTKNYNWKYKHNQGDGKYHFGPMAQAVQSKFGNQAAPGGTSIDLVTMNGYNMQGIKDLNTKVDTMIGTNQNTNTLLDSMRAVEANTLRTATAVEGLSNRFFLGSPFDLDFEKGKEKLGFFAQLFKKKSKEILDKGKEKGQEAWKNMFNAQDALTMGPFQPDHKRLSGRLLDFANSPSETIGGAVARVAALISGSGVKIAEKTISGMTGAYDFAKNNIVEPSFKFGKDLLKDNKENIKEALVKLTTGAWNLAGDLYNSTLDLVKNKIPKGLRGIWDQVKSTGEFIGSVLDEPVDIYVVGENEPRIRAQLMRLGGYIDIQTKKVITRPGMISGPVATSDGKVVLSTEDLTKGITDVEGKPIESLKWRITRYLKDRVMSTIGTMKDAWKKLSGKGRDLFDSAKDKLKNTSIGIRGYDRRIYNVLLDIRDIALAGINRGKPGGKITLRSMIDEKAEKEKSKAAPIPNQAKSSSESSETTSESSTEEKKSIGLMSWLKQKKDILLNKPEIQEAKSKLDGLKKSSKLQSIKDLFKKKAEAANEKRKDIQEKLKTKVESRYKGNNIFDNLGGKLSALTGLLGFGKKKKKDGEHPDTASHPTEEKKEQPSKPKEERAGSWKTRFKDQLSKANEKRKDIQEKLKAKVEARYKGKNVFDMIGEKLAAVKDFFSSAIDDVLSLAGGKGGLLGKVGKIGGRLAGGLLKGGGAVLRGAGSLVGKSAGMLSRGIGMAAEMIPGGGLGAIGRGALTVGRLGISAAGMLGEGALAAAGGIASSVAASPLLPFIAGAAAIGAVGYGLYKGYKYLTRDNVSEVDKIRIMEYGLLPEQSKYNHYLLGLENMVEQKAQLIVNGNVKVDATKLKWEDVFDMMDIKLNSDQGKEQASKFNQWFYSRFIPVYVQNRSALFAADPKLKMSEMSKLSGETLGTYLAKCDAPTSVYNVTTSPFPGLEQLSTTKESVQELIKKLKEQADKDSKDPKKKPSLPKATDTKTADGMEKADKALQDQVKNDAAASASKGAAIDKTLNNAQDGGPSNTDQKASDIAGTSNPGMLKKNNFSGNTTSVMNTVSSVEDQSVVPGSMTKLNSFDSESYKSLDGIKKMIEEASKVAGVDPNMMKTMAAIESNFKADASAGQNGAAKTSAGGLYQFINSTWHAMLMKYGAKYGLGMGASKFDPKANTLMAAEYIKENMKALKSVVPNITAEHVYAAHFLGPGGAKTLYTTPDSYPASQALPDAARSNASIFNGRTIGAIKEWIRGRIASVNKKYGISGNLTEVAAAGQADRSGVSDDTTSQSFSGKPANASKTDTIDTSNATTISQKDTIDTVSSKPEPKKTGFGGSAFDNPVNARQAATQYPQDTGVSKSPAAFGIPAPQTIRTPQYTPTSTLQPVNANQNASVTSGGGVVDVLSKSLDVQTKLYEVVLEMSKKLSPEAMGNVLSQLKSSQPDQSSGNMSSRPQGKEGFPKLPINLERASL